MAHDAGAPFAAEEGRGRAVERLVSLTAALADDLDRGAWVPEALERSLATRLLVGCAGDGQFTPTRVRETLFEGSVALTHAGDGRLARLLAQLHAVTRQPDSVAGPVLSEASLLLERVAGGTHTDGGRT